MYTMLLRRCFADASGEQTKYYVDSPQVSFVGIGDTPLKSNRWKKRPLGSSALGLTGGRSPGPCGLLSRNRREASTEFDHHG